MSGCFRYAVILLILLLTLASAKGTKVDTVASTCILPAHPRLLWLQEEENAVKQCIKKDTLWQQVHQQIMAEASGMCNRPVLERVMEGKRLLAVSREALKRFIYWGYAYRMTREKKYIMRAEQELVNVTGFKDWNPSHFLDVAEMSLGVAIGYDWFYNELKPETKHQVEVALMEKGLQPSKLKKSGAFVKRENNWNQVCEAGMVYAALAIWETQPEECAWMVNRAIKYVPLAMNKYGPDGAYVEGCGYWGYGTGFNVLMLSALEKVFHTDFGLCSTPGFMNTGNYLTHLTTPALYYFNYSDCGSTAGSAPCLFWFSSKTHNEGILYSQVQMLKRRGIRSLAIDQLAPTSIIWGHEFSLQKAKVPKKTYWQSTGVNPVCAMRTGWGETDAFLGVKLGTPNASHAHLDVGSFIYEDNGITWAMDMGGENYNSLEQAGVDLWNGKQNGGRWEVYRYHNSHHNTLCFDNKNQIVAGWVDFSKTRLKGKNKFAQADITSAYEGQVKKVVRSYYLYSNHEAVVEDDIEANENAINAVWTAMIPTQVKKVNSNELLLQYGSKQCRLIFEVEGNYELVCADATPKHAYEKQNVGVKCVQLHIQLQAGEKRHIKAKFVPVML